MHRRQRQHGDGDCRACHIDGRPQWNRDRIGIAIQIQLLAQRHIHWNVGGGTAGEERVNAAFAQAGEHQRIGVAADLPEHQQRVNHQRYQQHTAHQHQQQLGIAPQGLETGGRQGGRYQAEDPQRRKADHHFNDKGHRVGDVVDQVFGGVVTMTQGEAKPHRPHQNADIVGVQQSVDRVGHHAHQQAAQHLNNPRRRRDAVGGGG